MIDLKNILNGKQLTLLVVSLLAITALLSFVSRGVYSPQNYINKLHKSEGTFIQTKTFNGTDIKVMYQPPQYQACKQVISSEGKNNVDLGPLIEDYSNSFNYVLRMESPSSSGFLQNIISDQMEYQELVEYFSFGIQDDLSMVLGEEEFPCSFVHFERNYDVAPIVQIQIGFNINDDIKNRIKTSEEWTLRFNAERFGIGPLNFLFQTEILNDKPYIIN